MAAGGSGDMASLKERSVHHLPQVPPTQNGASLKAISNSLTLALELLRAPCIPTPLKIPRVFGLKQ